MPPLTEDKENIYLHNVEGWSLIRENIHRIKREFVFKDFEEAMRFVNKVADTAEDEGHHPDINIYYNKVILELYTHAINGLHLNDFVMAAKINEIYKNW
ncbi:MAG: 4a-hydroxytetrahydrobiopterin dehydratase [Promethearchaeota archaeon]